MKKPVCIFTFIIASLLSFSLQAETESGEWFQTGANQNSIKFFKSGVDEKTLKQAVLDTVKRYAQTIACNRGDGYRSVLSSKDGDNYFLFGIRPYKGEEYLWSYDKDKSPLYGVIWS
ncbi:MAG: hypothetical protein LBS89_00475, partial [Zoogloeaceae bacterium]|nr:hypothetical protein [Zoogloeaceae bacterium]